MILDDSFRQNAFRARRGGPVRGKTVRNPSFQGQKIEILLFFFPFF